MADENLRENLKIEQLADLREKTEMVSQLLQNQLKGYLDTLRPLLAPRRILGNYVRSSVKEDIPDTDVALKRLREKYKEVCGKPFALPAEFDESVLADMDNRLELYPWEYSHEASNEREKKTITVASPVKWALSYTSGYTVRQLREVLVGKRERRQEEVRQFLVNAMVVQLVLAKFPGTNQLLKDLRYDIGLDKCQGLGDLPLVTIRSSLPSFRPSDDIILAATRLSGVPAFIELIDFDVLSNLEDPFKTKIEAKLR
ncbi:MAG: hypothetical protein DME76_08535 [Verrucomicrobia bacterium]|nr:MAG: hypothetical protein DME76_08535 [Verrucomicrobiota bacterium]